MDEFMVSGETIVRDLQLGMAPRAPSSAARCRSATSPTCSATSRRCRSSCALAGLEHAVVWRGVPAAVDADRVLVGGARRLAACAPSTSTARTRTGATSPTTPSSSSHGRTSYELELGDGPPPRRRPAADERHRPPDAAAVARPRRRRGERRSRTTTGSSSRRSPSTSPTSRPRGSRPWTGELRSGARANVLMGVASNRVDVHQACAAAERAIERRAEPLSRAAAPPPTRTRTRCSTSRGGSSSLNSAHDSSCACSADEVVDQVVVRYHEARQIGDGLVRQTLRRARGRGRRAAGVDDRRQPDRCRPRRAGRRSPCPGDGPVHFVDADDGTPLPDAGARATIGGDGFYADASSARRCAGCSS